MAQKPVEYVNIEVDGKPLRVQKDQYLLWSLREAHNNMPHFCAHKWLNPPFGGCRMCMVQIETGGKLWPKLQTSCSTLPSEGMKVYTQSEPVVQSRKEQLEFHLLNHPLECPVCDKGGECMLQDQTFEHGLAEGRYIEEKRIRPDAIINEYMQMNYKRCFQCKRCVNYNEMIDGTHMMKFVKRGASTRIESFPPPGEAPRFSGNLIDICPVGAITARNYRFMGRPWEQELSASVGHLDSVGANVWHCARLGELTRIIPRDNDSVDFGYLDDATRFSWECTDESQRQTKAVLRRDGKTEEVSAGAGYEAAGMLLASVVGEHGPDSVGVIAGGGLTCEDYLAMRLLCGQALYTGYFHFGDELFGPGGPSAGDLANLIAHAGTIDNITHAATAFSIGCDLFEEAPVLGLRLDIAAHRGEQKLLSVRSHRSDADRYAAQFADYGYGNLQRVVRALVSGVKGGDCPADLAPIAQALKSCGADCAILFGAEVWRSASPAALTAELAVLRDAIAAANPGAVVWLNPVFPQCNSAGALLLSQDEVFSTGIPGAKPGAGSLRRVLEAAANGKLKALLIVDADPLTTYPDRALVEKALTALQGAVYVGAYGNPTAERCSAHLPLGTFAHSEGTLVSLEWRVQRRTAAAISPAPGLLEVLNSLCTWLEASEIAADSSALHARLTQMFPAWPQRSLAAFPAAGVLAKPVIAAQAAQAQGEVPAEFKGTAELPLVLIPKCFMYNDRQEIRSCPVFEKVDLPFAAFLNPLDMKVYNIGHGGPVELSAGGAKCCLEARSAGWVRQGSVVVNDYCLNAPANAVAGFEPLRVAAKRVAAPAMQGAAQ